MRLKIFVIMQFRLLNTLVQPASVEGGEIKIFKVMAMTWSPNNQKLAICMVRERESNNCHEDEQTRLSGTVLLTF